MNHTKNTKKFVKMFGGMYLNRYCVSLYEWSNGKATVSVETFTRKYSSLTFESVEAAEDWYADIPGNKAGKLANAINKVCGYDVV